MSEWLGSFFVFLIIATGFGLILAGWLAIAKYISHHQYVEWLAKNHDLWYDRKEANE